MIEKEKEVKELRRRRITKEKKGEEEQKDKGQEDKRVKVVWLSQLHWSIKDGWFWGGKLILFSKVITK